MACTQPIPAFYRKGMTRPKLLHRIDGNFEVYKQKYGDDFLLLPCGKCLSCQMDHSKDWAVRIMLEASLYSKTCFITLTFDDAFLPKKAVKKPFQDFMKRLRKKFYPNLIRFFACGEFGSKTKRFHYHAILFGCDFDDKRLIERTKSGSLIYSSALLSQLWPFGISSVGEVESASAGYVARYSMKKHLTGVDDGSFILMSRKPGIGRDLFDKKFFHTNKIYMSDGIYSVPRYFQKVLEVADPEFFEKWKQQVRSSDYTDLRPFYGFENQEEVLKYLSQCKESRFTKEMRGL